MHSTTRIATAQRPRVVIVGAGFGGLYAARALARVPVSLTVIDSRNFHLFQPLLYQVATAALSPGDIAAPVRAILRRQTNVAHIWMASVAAVEVWERRLRLIGGETVAYDYLIVATGATHTYFGHPEWERHAPSLKSIDDAIEIRRRFLRAFESAERQPDAAARARLLTFVIVGGGPTGVELAGAIAEIARHALPREYATVDTSTARVLLLEGGSRLLPAFPPPLSAKAEAQLHRLGVETRTNALVTAVAAGAVTVGNERIEAANVFWAAGVAASPLGAALGAPRDRAGRVHVAPDLSLAEHPEVFVVGDLARVEQDGALVPGVAPAAMQMGRHAARMIRADLRRQPRTPFRYRDKGSLAVIGRAAAVADIAGLRLSGLVAWLVWLFVHIMYLVGFRNRIIVLIEWAWSYLLYQRGVRLITGTRTEQTAEPRLTEPRTAGG